MYNYREAMKNDIREWIQDNMTGEDFREFETADDLSEHLDEVLWVEDSVTGNGSGSYTFNRAKAKEYVFDNFALLIEACREFCVDFDEFGKHAYHEDFEWMDSTIRCYLLNECIGAVIEEMENDAESAWNNRN